MEFKSEQKFILLSPRKLRPVVRLVKKLVPVKAIEVLKFVNKRGSAELIKVVKSALANAGQKGYMSDSLVFKEVLINEGPRLKRGQPVSRGRWHPIKKRMSHIRVVLTTKNSKLQMPNAKSKESDKKVEKIKIAKQVKKGTKNGTKN